MPNINYHIANSTGELDHLLDLISKSLSKVLPIVEIDLNANRIDIIFISAAKLTIPEYGIGGNSPGPHHIYIAFNPKSSAITQQGLEETLLHEIHHCMRWRGPGYGSTLGEAIISEGLACLYEEQHSGKVPIYAKVKIKNNQIAEAKKELDLKKYNHAKWFFGTGNIDKWFGYSYGYKLCKDYSFKNKKKASELVNTVAQKILNERL